MHKNLATKSPLALFIVAFLAITPMSVQANDITVYKNPSCGCCNKWVTHLRQNGFKVSTHDVKNVVPHKIKLGVTPQLASCHTAVIAGYTIEGHVPAAEIKRLLSEKPNIKGLSVPRMPRGTPGMEGKVKDSYDVVAFDSEGKTSVYKHYK